MSQVNTKNTPVEIQNASIDSVFQSIVKPFVLKNAEGKPIPIDPDGWAALEAGKIEFLSNRVSKKKHLVAVIINLQRFLILFLNTDILYVNS